MITDYEVISIRRIDGAGNLKAFVDVKVGCFVFTQCSVMEGKRGLMFSLPRQLARDGRWRDTIICTDLKVQESLAEFILNAYNKETENVQAADQ